MKYTNIWNPEMETLSAEELRERFELPLLRKQIDFVARNSEFYREKFRQANIESAGFLKSDDEIRNIPFTEKKEVVGDQQDNPPYGRLLAVPPESVNRVHSTSGYSSRPVLILLTRKDIEDTLEAGARTFWCAGVRPDDMIVHCLNYSLWIGGLTDHMSLERTGAMVVPFGVGNSKRMLEFIHFTKPSGISCTPSYLSKLEIILRDEFGLSPRDLGLKKGIFGGEAGVQSPEVRRNIEEKWGINAIDGNFGVSDILSAFGSECEMRDGLHFHGQGIIWPELIDPETGMNLEIKKGQTGELVYTNLVREAQPFIRFRSSDVAEIIHVGTCECGRTSFRFRILGRSDDMLTVKGINVFPLAIANFLGMYSDILTGEFEVYIDTSPPYEYLRIHIEYNGDLNKEEREKVREMLQKRIREDMLFTARIEMIPEGTLPRSEGKTRRIRKK